MYSVVYQVFVGRAGVLTTKRRDFKTEKACTTFIEKLEQKDNFYRIVATCKD